ncbi:MAG TPA: hypothetical protein VM617_05370, partial [Thermoanaerobaculia bacterium]|nr:hypothetical protein [Thermoanaerobaculia bacterium]
ATELSEGPEPRFDEHLRRLRPRLDSVRPEAGNDLGVLALLAVESFYRPPWRRGGEYLLWAVGSLLGPRRVERLSVGPGQVQLRHWLDLGLLSGLRFTPRRLAVVRDWSANARAVRGFLATRGGLGERDAGRLTRIYTGGNRPGFAPRLAAVREALGDDGARRPPPATRRGDRP